MKCVRYSTVSLKCCYCISTVYIHQKHTDAHMLSKPFILHKLHSFTFCLSQLNSKRSSSFRRAIANGRRTLQREILLDETGLGVYKRFVRYVAYEILPCETDRRWYFHQNRLCPPPVFMAIITIVQVHLTELLSCYSIWLFVLYVAL